MKFRQLWYEYSKCRSKPLIHNGLSATCLILAILWVSCENPDTTPPTITITNPKDGVTLTESVTIKVNASDDEVVDMVEFIVDSEPIGTTGTAPYDFEWNVSFWADGQTHRILAKATDPSGNEGLSESISVTVSEEALFFSLFSPLDDEIIRNTNEIHIRWRPLKGAASYDLEVSTETSFSEITYSVSLVDTFATTTILTQTVHYWRVRGVNDIGEETEWSAIRSFLLDGPEAPDLISPTNSAVIIGVSPTTLGWNSSEYATLYEVNVSLSTSFASNDLEGTTAETSLITTALGNGIYSWRVRAQNSVGFWGEWSSTNTFIQSDVTIFAKTFGESLLDEGTFVHQTDDEGYVIAGHQFTDHFIAGGNLDVILVKTDSEGSEDWSNTYDAGDTDFGLSLAPTSDGGYIIVGYSFISAENPYDVLLIKTDGSGNELWLKLFDRSVFDAGRSVQQTTDGGYIITGRTQSADSLGSDVWLIKTDVSGNEEWNRVFGGSSFENSNSVLETVDGGFIIAGELCCFVTFGLLIKTDSNGIEEWSKTYSGISEFKSISQTSDGGYIIGGSNGFQPILLKTDVDGVEEWRNAYTSFSLASSKSARQTVEGGYILTGIDQEATETQALLLLKTDELGNVEWQKKFGVGDAADGRSVQQTSDGGYIITGTINEDIWLIKTNSEGITVF